MSTGFNANGTWHTLSRTDKDGLQYTSLRAACGVVRIYWTRELLMNPVIIHDTYPTCMECAVR